MHIQLDRENFDSLTTSLLIVPVFSDQKRFPGGLAFLKEHIHPAIEEIMNKPGFEAKLNQKRWVDTTYSGYPTVCLLGAGKINEWDMEKARQLWGEAIQAAKALKVKDLAIYWDGEFPCPGDYSLFIPEVTSALYTANFRFTEFQTKREDLPPSVEKVHFLFPNAEKNTESLIRNGQHLGNSVNLARRLTEIPSNQLYPEKFVEEINNLSEQFGWETEVLDERELRRQGLNALIAVAQGSEHPPYLAISRYKHPEAKKTVALVGKGVTFDTGGISLKPSKNMEEMKYDMSGAAAVLGALQAVSLTRVPVNVIMAVPLVENMPSGKATRPGDVVKSYSGKTIEIINIDAEGRLILADTLSYVEKNYQPDFIVDLATLTGAVIVALGHLAGAVLTRHTELLEALEEAANISGERIWRLPLWEDYEELMKSKIADVRNVATKPQAGTITGAIFLKNFVEKTPWAHLDIAGTAYNMPEKSYRPEGATGFGVRLLWHWMNILAKS